MLIRQAIFNSVVFLDNKIYLIKKEIENTSIVKSQYFPYKTYLSTCHSCRSMYLNTFGAQSTQLNNFGVHCGIVLTYLFYCQVSKSKTRPQSKIFLVFCKQASTECSTYNAFNFPAVLQKPHMVHKVHSTQHKNSCRMWLKI